MKLQIKRRSGDLYDISGNHKSVGLKRSSYQRRLDIIDKSYQDGADFIGERRTGVGSLTVTIELQYNNDTAYRTAVNELYQYFSEIEYLQDTDNSTETKCEFDDFDEGIFNDVGSTLRHAKLSFKLIQLIPYWQDINYNEVSETGQSPTLVVNNAGYIPTPCIIELEATSACTAFAFWVEANEEGIEIQDLSFGTVATLQDYIVNNETGEALLGDDEINRNNRIRGGSGFFLIPPGVQNISSLTSIALDDITIKWKNRYIL